MSDFSTEPPNAASGPAEPSAPKNAEPSEAPAPVSRRTPLPAGPGRFLGLFLVLLFFVPTSPAPRGLASKVWSRTRADDAVSVWLSVGRTLTSDPTRALDATQALSERERATRLVVWRGYALAYGLEAIAALGLLLLPRVRLPRAALTAALAGAAGFGFRALYLIAKPRTGHHDLEAQASGEALAFAVASVPLVLGALATVGLRTREKWLLVVPLGLLVICAGSALGWGNFDKKIEAVVTIAAVYYEAIRTARAGALGWRTGTMTLSPVNA